MRVSLHGFFLILITVLQTTWLDCLEIFNVKPNLFLIYVVTLSFFCTKKESIILGVIYGFLYDLSIGRFLGINALMCAGAGFFTVYFCEKILSNKSIISVALVTLVLSFFYESSYCLFVFFVTGKIDLGYAFRSVILLESFYNGIAAVLLYPVLKKLTKFMYADKGENIG